MQLHIFFPYTQVSTHHLMGLLRPAAHLGLPQNEPKRVWQGATEPWHIGGTKPFITASFHLHRPSTIPTIFLSPHIVTPVLAHCPLLASTYLNQSKSLATATAVTTQKWLPAILFACHWLPIYDNKTVSCWTDWVHSRTNGVKGCLLMPKIC